MKITIWQPKVPAIVGDMKDEFAHRLSAFRAATGHPERFVTRCACAVHDKGFTVVYERPDLARPFVLTGVYKDGEGDATVSAGASRSRKLPVTDIDPSGWRCPYCGNEMHIDCHHCHTTVCGGKTRRYPGTSDIFTCRVSCGARGTLTEAEIVEGVEPTRRGSGFRCKLIASSPPAQGTLRLEGRKTPHIK